MQANLMKVIRKEELKGDIIEENRLLKRHLKNKLSQVQLQTKCCKQ